MGSYESGFLGNQYGLSAMTCTDTHTHTLACTYEHIDADDILFSYDSHNSIQAPLTCRLGLRCAVLLWHRSLGLVVFIFVLRILVLTSLLVALRRLLLVAIIIVLWLPVLGSLLRIHVFASLHVAFRRLLLVAIILVLLLLSWGVSLGSLSVAAP